MELNKKKALERLSAIEKETEELKKIINGVKEYTIADLLSYKVACEVLGCIYEPKMPEVGQLKTIIRAANFIDNGNKIWTPVLSSNSYNYFPYFEKADSGFRFSVVCFDCSVCCIPAAFYFKNRATAELIAKRFLTLYIVWLKED